MKKLAMLLTMLPLAAWADLVPIYQPVEIYHWSRGELEVYSILVAFVMVGVCLLVGMMSKLRKRTIGTMTMGIFISGRYCPKCNPRHSEDGYRFSDHEAIGTE